MSDAVRSDRAIDLLLAEYGESHQNPTNKLIHWIAVPTIFWTVVAFLWSIPVPTFMASSPLVNWATICLVLTVAYYVMLSVPLAIGMLIFSLFCIGDIMIYERLISIPLWQTALGLFVIAWIFQFYGHKVEGKKPSFFKDIQFLMVGPAWLMAFIYRRFGIDY